MYSIHISDMPHMVPWIQVAVPACTDRGDSRDIPQKWWPATSMYTHWHIHCMIDACGPATAQGWPYYLPKKVSTDTHYTCIQTDAPMYTVLLPYILIHFKIRYSYMPHESLNVVLTANILPHKNRPNAKQLSSEANACDTCLLCTSTSHGVICCMT